MSNFTSQNTTVAKTCGDNIIPLCQSFLSHLFCLLARGRVIYDWFTPKHTFHVLHWSHSVLPPLCLRSCPDSGSQLVLAATRVSSFVSVCVDRRFFAALKTSRSSFFFFVGWHNWADVKLPVPGCLCQGCQWAAGRPLLERPRVLEVHSKCVCLRREVEDALVNLESIYQRAIKRDD